MPKALSYRFCFGPWNLSEGQDPYGPTTRTARNFDWKLAQLKKHGFDAMMFHDDDAVPDDEDDALLDAQDDYRDQIANLGDDTPFGPTLAATASIGQGMLHDYEVVRQRLACPSNLEPG